MAHWKHPETRAAIASYQALIVEQASWPANERWRLGADIKQAKAGAYAAMEFERTGIRT